MTDWTMGALEYKGVPLWEKLDASQLAARGWRVAHGEASTPVATLAVSALHANAAAMRAFCDAHQVSLAPHAKTTLSTGLLDLQVKHGAWAMTAALPRQVALLWSHGIQNVLLANEVSDVDAVSWLVGQLAQDADKELWLYADSVRGVDLLRQGRLRARGDRGLNVLVELGHAGGRTGCRTIGEALEVARHVVDADGLRLAGVAGYEGTLGSTRDPDVVDAVDKFASTLRELASSIIEQGWLDPQGAIVTAGGSLFFDRIAHQLSGWCASVGARMVLRSGCYLIHDHGLYAAGTPANAGVADAPTLRPALSVWARVVSHPEPGLSLVDAGRRDVSHDAGLPVPLTRHRGDDVIDLAAAGATVSGLSDQHAFVSHPAELDIVEGDVIRLGISHPCTTLDRWRSVLLVDDENRVTGAVRTSF